MHSFFRLAFFVPFFLGKIQITPLKFGVTGFYTPKFQKLDFTPWNLIPLAIHTLRLISVVKWHMRMLTCFIFAKSAQKLRRFNEK